MIFALVLLPIVAIVDFGGIGPVLAELESFDPTFIDPTALAAGAAIGFLGIGLGSSGNPHIIVRYMSIADPRQLRYSAVVGTFWNVAMGVGAVAIGVVGRAYFATADMLPGADTEQLYPMLAQQHLHPILFGVVVASIFAAIMSTADSQLLVAASAAVRDVYEKVLHRGEEIPQRQLVRLSRVAVVLLVAMALGVGVVADQLVFWLVLFAWAGLGAALGPTSLLAIYWKGTTRTGVLAGLVTGTLTVVVWYYTPALKGALYELIPAFGFGLLVTVVVSRLTPRPRDADAPMAATKKNARRSSS